ncbi:MAG TPA: LysE family transporter [Bacteroidales bacterium]|nr:LysE family transporter [Bacteroidales bacterium]HQI69355.1 LysE family transporter [Bacteroidales bacterium]
MILEFLYKGLILGFSVAAPVGPIGILCINRTINKNFIAGFVSGLGAATADLIYGLIAGSGLTAISTFLINQKMWIQLIGLAFLFYIGIKTIMKKGREIEFNPDADRGLLKDYLTTLFLTITNPMTILFFIAVFAGLGLSKTVNGFDSVIQLTTGVFVGSCIWWLFLSGLTNKLKTKINKTILRKIDLVSGIMILFFGLLILIDLTKDIK